jgi:hypothetical protein
MKKTSADYWAPRINAEWRKSHERTIAIGRELISAKQACEHGEFLRMFHGHDNAVVDPVPFGINAAQRLMKVAEHPVLSNADQSQHLPDSYQTLYELTKLDDEQIVAGIKAGEITPDMTRSQAAALHADPVEKPDKPPHEEMASAVKNAVTKFVGQLSTHEQYAYVRRRMQELLAFLSEMEAENGVGRPREKSPRARAG